MPEVEAVEILKGINKFCDREVAHIYADRVLTEFLKELGYNDLVEEYEAIPKWYA